MRRIGVLLAAAGLVVVSGAQASDYRPPRTVDGVADLQGAWGDPLDITPFERPKAYKTPTLTDAQAIEEERKLNNFAADEQEYYDTHPTAPNVGDPDIQWMGDAKFHIGRIGGQARSSILIDPADGQLPMRPETRARLKAKAAQGDRNFDSVEMRPLQERCLSMSGPPLSNTDMRIVQTHDHVVLDIAHAHGPRIVRMTDRDHSPAAMAQSMGDSVGWWDGDTLVVETTHFGATMDWQGRPLSRDAVVTERLSRISAKELLIRFTVNDPVNYTHPWSGQLVLMAQTRRLPSYECHEGNYALANILAGARRVEADGGTPEPLDGDAAPPAPKTDKKTASAASGR